MSNHSRNIVCRSAYFYVPWFLPWISTLFSQRRLPFSMFSYQVPSTSCFSANYLLSFIPFYSLSLSSFFVRFKSKSKNGFFSKISKTLNFDVWNDCFRTFGYYNKSNVCVLAGKCFQVNLFIYFFFNWSTVYLLLNKRKINI